MDKIYRRVFNKKTRKLEYKYFNIYDKVEAEGLGIKFFRRDDNYKDAKIGDWVETDNGKVVQIYGIDYCGRNLVQKRFTTPAGPVKVSTVNNFKRGTEEFKYNLLHVKSELRYWIKESKRPIAPNKRKFLHIYFKYCYIDGIKPEEAFRKALGEIYPYIRDTTDDYYYRYLKPIMYTEKFNTEVFKMVIQAGCEIDMEQTSKLIESTLKSLTRKASNDSLKREDYEMIKYIVNAVGISKKDSNGRQKNSNLLPTSDLNIKRISKQQEAING